MLSTQKSFSNLLAKLILVVILFSFTINTYAQFGGPSRVKAKLIAEVTSLQPGQAFWIAVQLKMHPGWHVYWRNVGDTGLETTVDWQLPEGLEAGELEWPFPERIVEEPLVVYGYHGEIHLLQKIKVDKSVKPGTKLKIGGKISWLVCAETCVPGDTTIFVELPVKKENPAAVPEHIQLFSDARVQLPLKHSDWQFSAMVEDKQLTIQAVAPEWLKGDFKRVLFFPYQTNFISYGAEQNLQKSGQAFRLSIPLAENDLSIPDTLKGILFSQEGWRGPGSEKAVEIIVPLSDELAQHSTASSGLNSIWLALLFSFLGGIILNLMPCVLPVLSIKIMGFIKQAHDEHIAPWKHGLSFTIGVLFSFLALAGLLLLLKAGGEQLGWGFQLQSPGFLIFVTVFMFLFGLSLLGVFQIGASMTTVGGKAQNLKGLSSSFMSGILATIVATPCTAPFMGSALGFALAQPAWVALLVFFFLGLGMAAPFLLISSIPALMKYVPKPGRWMESLEQFMGFLLLATVVWLLWVLGIQVGANALMLVIIGLLFSGFAAWIYGRWGNMAMPKRTRIIAWMLALVFLLGSNAYVMTNIDKYAVLPQQSATPSEGIQWQQFSAEKLETLLKQNKPVFIDFTAAWCLSCQVNEQVAFSSQEVQNKFAELGITALKADWTKRDAKIAKALAKYGRNSVPLYVLYDGKSSEPQLLPEIITPGIVLDALNNLK